MAKLAPLPRSEMDALLLGRLDVSVESKLIITVDLEFMSKEINFGYCG